MLEEYRSELDALDSTLEECFIKRMQTVKKIAEYKAQQGLPTRDASREAQILEKHCASAPEELAPYMKEYFRKLLALSRKYQDELRRSK